MNTPSAYQFGDVAQVCAEIFLLIFSVMQCFSKQEKEKKSPVITTSIGTTWAAPPLVGSRSPDGWDQVLDDNGSSWSRAASKFPEDTSTGNSFQRWFLSLSIILCSVCWERTRTFYMESCLLCLSLHFCFEGLDQLAFTTRLSRNYQKSIIPHLYLCVLCDI